MRKLLSKTNNAFARPLFASRAYFNIFSSPEVVRRRAPITALVCLAILSLASSKGAGSPSYAAPKAQNTSNENVPPYHDSPPETPLPAVMDPKQFDKAIVRNAYRFAAKLRDVLYQQPCYCHCDRHKGHTSLLDCYTGTHTAGCTICLQELFYAHEQTEKGRTPAQIRNGIIRGEWKTVDTKKYDGTLADSQQVIP